MAPLTSWLAIDSSSHFSLHNIPFGIISTAEAPDPHPAIAIGNYALNLQVFTKENGFAALSVIPPHQLVFSSPTLNEFAALGRPIHRVVREYLQSILLKDGPFPAVLEDNQDLRRTALVPIGRCQLYLPLHINDYTDFYAGLNHAYNVGVLFRGPVNALQPNYKHLPVGYHGRASSVVVSGTPIRRPNGQIIIDPSADGTHPELGPSRKLDIELELGCFVCKPSALGEPVPIKDAPEHLFGMVLMNDWSARDIQAWEYVPLGPFNAKNFGTTISPWVVLMDALEPFAVAGLTTDTKLLPYLEHNRLSHFPIRLSASITTASGQTTQLTSTSAENLLFSFPQMLTHHTVGGCPFNTGDLLGSGTISGDADNEKGCLLEMTKNGAVEIELNDGERRTFLQDGDVITITGICGDDGALVGFGECMGRIEAALQL
nr:fumarylacetoacetase [Quercus suber]